MVLVACQGFTGQKPTFDLQIGPGTYVYIEICLHGLSYKESLYPILLKAISLNLCKQGIKLLLFRKVLFNFFFFLFNLGIKMVNYDFYSGLGGIVKVKYSVGIKHFLFHKFPGLVCIDYNRI